MDDLLDRAVYPLDPWRLIDLTSANTSASESVFAIGNGFLGLRGRREEDGAAPTCFVNGFYETWAIKYPETAYGLARDGQAMQPAPDASHVTLMVDDTFLGDGVPVEQRRELDLAAGVMRRQTVWETPNGLVRVDAKRLVSFTRRGLLAAQFEVTPLAHDAQIEIVNGLTTPQSQPTPNGQAHDPRSGTVLGFSTMSVSPKCSQDGCLSMTARTEQAGVALTVALHHDLVVAPVSAGAPVLEPQITVRAEEALARWRVSVPAGRCATLTVLAWYTLDEDEDTQREQLRLAATAGWDGLAAEQRAWLDDAWSRADVEVGDPALQQAIRWSLFQAMQGSARADGAGIGAKGVTGPGYDGHYFWDMETYVLPFLTYTAPPAARAALSYRLTTLPLAIERAAELHLAGALFPWRTINGREASAYYEAGTAQYHIDADIAHALNQYVAASGDVELMDAGGQALLVETARLWASLGFFGDDGHYHLHGVTGPDEYSALVDDNVYTNLMAKANLVAAAQAVQADPEMAAEAGRWLEMAKAMFVPYDEARQLHPQDAHFLEHETWELSSVPPQNFPLLLHYHPLTIYRRQVLKQADVVLAQVLCPGEFTPAQKRANFDYYDHLTTGDSSLSAVPQAIAAAEVGRGDLAVEYLWRAVFVDLANSHGNSDAGVHLAVAAGVWSVLVAGFGGLRDTGGKLNLWPRLPGNWPYLRFKLTWHASVLSVEVTQTGVWLSVAGPSPVSLEIWGQAVCVEPSTRVLVEKQGGDVVGGQGGGK